VFGPLAHAQLPTITVEAENYSEVTGGTIRVLDRADASGGKCVSYWEEPGVAITVQFQVEQAGTYCLTVRYACAWEDTRRQIAVDGQVPPGLDVMTLLGTGSWDAFDVMTLAGQDGGRLRLDLDAGKHTLTLSNVDSRGLAWDCALLHDPRRLMGDVPLSDAELAELAEKLPPPATRILSGDPGGEDWVIGDVTIAFADNGEPAAFRVEDLFLTVMELSPARGKQEDIGLGPFTLRTQVLRADGGDRARWVLMTAGHCVYILAVATRDLGAGHPPAPLVQWRAGQAWHLAAAPRLFEGEQAACVFGTVMLSAVGPLTAAERAHPLPHLELTWPWLQAGDTSVAALKIGQVVTPGDSTIAAEVQGNEIIIRSSKEMYPALAAFYGMPQFECRVAADGSMTFTAQGEELTLRAP
jgi:hypothetical protein